MGEAKNFSNRRQVAAWLGLVPRQRSSGGRTNLLSMSKRGDTYVRTLLTSGSRSMILAMRRKTNSKGWLNELLRRRNANVEAVALANKNARITWALLAHDRSFRSDYARTPA